MQVAVLYFGDFSTTYLVYKIMKNWQDSTKVRVNVGCSEANRDGSSECDTRNDRK